MNRESRLVLIAIFASILLFASVLPALSQPEKIKVVFISVATETEVFWSGIHGLAEAAAKDLDIDLELLISNRNHLTAISMAEEVSNRPNKPDYAIVVGEKMIASNSIPVLTANGIKVFLLGNLSADEKAIIGAPREKYPNYIGKMAIDDYMVGYLTAEMMVKEAGKLNLRDSEGNLNFLAFEGVRRTSFSSERLRGLNDILKKYPEVKILQSVPTEWRYADAKRILPRLLDRYEKYKIAGVWCANSRLAMASSDVLQGLGKTHGVDFVTAGTDWDRESIESVYNGDILGIAGGHVAMGGWIVTLINDYHHGIDFDSSVFLNKVTVMDKASSGKFLSNFSTSDWDIIDFRNYSKAENKNHKNYDFSFNAILKDL